MLCGHILKKKLQRGNLEISNIISKLVCQHCFPAGLDLPTETKILSKVHNTYDLERLLQRAILSQKRMNRSKNRSCPQCEEVTGLSRQCTHWKDRRWWQQNRAINIGIMSELPSWWQLPSWHEWFPINQTQICYKSYSCGLHEGMGFQLQS